jgi:inner membrane transporter RhtA
LALFDRPAPEAVDPAAPGARPALGLARVPPWGLLLGGVASIQFGAALAATLFDELGPGGTTLARLGFAAIILLALARPRLRGLPRSDLRIAVLLGLTLAAMNFCFYHALDRIPLGVAVTVEFIGPLAVAIAGSRKVLDALWVALAAGGILLLSPGASGADAVGLLLAAVAGGFWAAYILVNARVAHAFAGADGLAIAMVVSTVFVAVPGAIDGGAALLDPTLLALGAAVALLSSALPYTLETEALRRLRPSVFGVLMSLEPAVAALAGLLVLGQRLQAREVVAIALVVAASVGALRQPEVPPPVDA